MIIYHVRESFDSVKYVYTFFLTKIINIHYAKLNKQNMTNETTGRVWTIVQ